MLVPSSPRARSRRFLALLAAVALALVGLVATPAAEAAANPTLSVTPNPATPGAVQTFAVTITGGSSVNIAAVDVTIPAGFTGVSFVSLTAANAWTTNYVSASQRFELTVDENNDKIDDTESITLSFQAQAPASTGTIDLSVASWSNRNRAGDPNFTGTAPIGVGIATQTITFAPLADKTYGDAAFTVSATGGGSGNPVTFTATGDCTATGTNGATITITGAGSCSVTAHQAAGNGYSAAPDVTRSFTIAPADQTITLAPIATQTFGGGPVTVSASASSGLTVALAASGACTLTGTSLSLDGAGQCTVTADQAGNANYNAAVQQQVTFTINKAGATLALGDLGPYGYDGNPHAASATTTPSGLTGVTLTYDGSSTPPTDAGSYAVEATLDNPNYAATSVTGTLVIDPKHVTGAFTADGKTYDGTTAATIAGCSLPGTVAGDDVSIDCSGATATFASDDAGTHAVSLTGAVLAGSDAGNYVLDGVADTSATIDVKTVTGQIQAADKTYDGTADATATGIPLAGAIGSDDVGVHVVSASFADKNVGTDKTVTATIELTGDDAGNYVLSSTTATDQATIWAKVLTGSFTADDKVYDGGAAATTHPDPLTGLIGTEDVSLVVTNAQFADKNVGTDKVVTADLALGGPDASNYALSSDTGTATADITAKPVTGAISASDKVYDGGTSASATGQPLAGKVGSDDVSVVVDAASFDTKDVGTGKTVTATIHLTGADAGNYSLSSSTATTTAAITAKQLTGSFTADDKVYDGTAAATTHPDALTGIVGTEDVSLVVTNGHFADKNVGADKTVTGTLSLTGAGAGNYALTSTTGTTTADITAKSVTGSFTAANKVWDGTTAATILTRTLTGAISGDAVSLGGGSATFDTAAVGTGKTVTATGFTLGGDDAGNYTLVPGPWTTTASITALYRGTGFYQPVDMTPVGGARVYNTIKGGQTVPLKFDVYNALTGAEQTSLSIFGADAAAQAAAFKVNKVACTATSTPDDAIELITTGATTLRYDGTAPTGQFIQNWKTPTTVGTCYSVSVVTVDGSSVGPAYFKITK